MSPLVKLNTNCDGNGYRNDDGDNDNDNDNDGNDDVDGGVLITSAADQTV